MSWVDLDKSESLFWARHARTGSTHLVAGFEVVVVNDCDLPVMSRFVEFHPFHTGQIVAVQIKNKRVVGRFELRTGG